MATVLLVVGNSADLVTDNDDDLKMRLEVLGHTVTVADDNDTEVTTGFDAIVISESCSSTTIGTKYRDSVKGMIVLEQGLWDDFNFQTTVTTQTNDHMWTILATDGLDGGLSGEVQVFSPASNFHREATTNLGAGVILVMDEVGQSGYYAYESGATMFSGNAPARRVALSFLAASVPNITADGWLLFNDAVTWVINAAAGATAALTGTAIGGITESDIVAGGKTIIITLTGDTFIP